MLDHDYRSGLPDQLDPGAGFGAVAPTRSALTLRLVLAAFGLLVCASGAVVSVLAGVTWLAVVLAVLALVAVVDLVAIARRARRGDPA